MVFRGAMKGPVEGAPESDELGELVRRARAGDGAARELLMQRHLPGLRAYVRLHVSPFLRAQESSSDLVQSVCLNVLENLDGFQYRDEARFRHWLSRLALNKIIDRERYFRAEQRAPRPRAATDRSAASIDELADPYASLLTPSHVAMSREEIRSLEAAFDRLPAEYREVITLARIVGLPHGEIASQMNRSEQAIRSLLRRAVVRLAAILDATEA